MSCEQKNKENYKKRKELEFSKTKQDENPEKTPEKQDKDAEEIQETNKEGE